MIDVFVQTITDLWQESGLAAMQWQNWVMIAISFVLVYLAIVKGFVENDIYLTENEISRSIETKILTIYKNWKNGNASSDEALRALRNLTETGFAEGITYNDWALLSVQIYEAEHNILSKKPNC